jgi:hypothetical protein
MTIAALTNIKEEPRTSSTEEDATILPLGVVVPEIGPASLRSNQLGGLVLDGRRTADLVGVALALASHVGTDILIGLDDITSNIKSITGGFRDSQTIVESNTGRDSTEADDNTPHLVYGELANTRALAHGARSLQGLLEADSHDQGDKRSRELTDTLHGKDGAHHSTTPFGRREPDNNTLD